MNAAVLETPLQFCYTVCSKWKRKLSMGIEISCAGYFRISPEPESCMQETFMLRFTGNKFMETTEEITLLTIAICDNEKTVAGQIETLLYDISQKHGIPIETDVFYSGPHLAHQIWNGKKYDIIYLDIEMEGVNGITAAEQIRTKDENVLLVFVSGYEKYMMELFRLDVLAFVKKPLDRTRFENIFLDANQRICKQRFYFTYHYKNTEYKTPCMDILYFESEGRKIIIHLQNGILESFNGKLNDVEKQLDDGKIPFLRIHKSYFVNYHHIKARAKAEIILTNGTRLPVSREIRNSFGTRYSRLLGGEIDV